MFESVKQMSDAIKPVATILTDRLSVTNIGAMTGDLVDKLAWTAAFGADADIRGTARWLIRSLAAAHGVRPTSINKI